MQGKVLLLLVNDSLVLDPSYLVGKGCLGVWEKEGSIYKTEEMNMAQNVRENTRNVRYTPLNHIATIIVLWRV